MKPILDNKSKTEIDLFLKQPTHALLIKGRNGAGKRHIAEYIAENLLKKKITNHPYFIEIGSTEGFGIEEVRQLQRKLSLSVPGNADVRRVVLLSGIDAYRHEAQNALLKTLEEPPENTVILATAVRQDRVLPTIRSRVRELSVRPVSKDAAVAALSTKFSSDRINSAYLLSRGDVGLLLSLLEQDKDHELYKAIDAAKQLLAKNRYQRLCHIETLLKNKDLPPSHLIDALYRIFNASLSHSIDKSNQASNKTNVLRLQLINEARKDLDYLVSQKLILTRLLCKL